MQEPILRQRVQKGYSLGTESSFCTWLTKKAKYLATAPNKKLTSLGGQGHPVHMMERTISAWESIYESSVKMSFEKAPPALQDGPGGPESLGLVNLTLAPSSLTKAALCQEAAGNDEHSHRW
ncbi:hypothetical protein H257_17880 [Aphanomyces astaci]|uniref:Uncharacterized protein n=1 Tax=Aphanomyces astaci TaxID=112090 RepID=W4GTP5_APHAT|nr:hypothetical protein H257_04790 [Aphanomyces astaci]XP_009845134.1 hypothetical protein H257_17880 [Aphanomyces astaci]ETV65389.1 hypothetical protein H257_17880 [Aphanomyces astaci]ETV83047.1 hypothetical protein H257_04790 [Aphanomyces astaci]|eukprot:XP_009827718.1 hypothetical protein H257_04790 [Aphanomyces astaci]